MSNLAVTEQTANVAPFAFDGHDVRVLLRDGEPWFVAKDVATLLGYSNVRDAIGRHCKGGSETRLPSNGGMQTVVIIPERDVYRLVMRSKLPAAERFEEWVVGEVLTSIRKTGSYGKDPMELLADPAALRQLLSGYADRVQALETKVAADQPKVEFYDDYANADGLIGLQNAARILDQGPNKFVGWLKQSYLFYQGTALVPRVQYIHQGIFEVVTTIVDDKARPRTFVTPKGVQYFAKKLGVTPGQPSLPGVGE